MILEALKTRTQTQHRSIERSLDLLNTTTTRDEYRALLTGFYGFYAPLETQVAATIRSHTDFADFDYDSRRKTPLLHTDLAALGLSASHIARLPQCDTLPAVANAAQVFGYLYVAEGSTLGGQIIARHFARTLGIDARNGGAFFRSHGEHTATMWREFQRAITTFASNAEYHDEIVASACETFSRLETWLKTAGVKMVVSPHHYETSISRSDQL